MEVFPDCQVVRDHNGVIRFREYGIARFFCDAHETFRGAPSLNDLVTAYFRGEFPMEEAMLYWQDIGYSLSSYLDIFGDEVTKMQETGIRVRRGCLIEKDND